MNILSKGACGSYALEINETNTAPCATHKDDIVGYTVIVQTATDPILAYMDDGTIWSVDTIEEALLDIKETADEGIDVEDFEVVMLCK